MLSGLSPSLVSHIAAARSEISAILVRFTAAAVKNVPTKLPTQIISTSRMYEGLLSKT